MKLDEDGRTAKSNVTIYMLNTLAKDFHTLNKIKEPRTVLVLIAQDILRISSLDANI